MYTNLYSIGNYLSDVDVKPVRLLLKGEGEGLLISSHKLMLCDEINNILTTIQHALSIIGYSLLFIISCPLLLLADLNTCIYCSFSKTSRLLLIIQTIIVALLWVTFFVGRIVTYTMLLLLTPLLALTTIVNALIVPGVKYTIAKIKTRVE